MKTLEQLPAVPESGIVIRPEGALLRLFFDIARAQPVASDGDEFPAVPADLYACDNVDVPAPFTYGAIVSAIVNDRYTADDVQALVANYTEARDTGSTLTEEKRAEYVAEWGDFQQLRAKAKEIAAHVTDRLNH